MKVSTLIKENIKKVPPLSNNWIRYLYYPRFKDWMQARETEGRIFDTRYQMYDYINNGLLVGSDRLSGIWGLPG